MPDLKSWFVIINPEAGSGKALKQWPSIQNQLKEQGFNFEFSLTEITNQNNTIIENAIKKGFTKFISIGGDGTLHQVVNAIMKQKIISPNLIKVGIIPIGTGNDWAKHYNIPTKISLAISTIKRNHILTQDIGKITFLNTKNAPEFFVNIAGIGFDAFVAKSTQKLKRFGAFSYIISALLGMFKFKNFNIKVVTPNKTIVSKSLMTLIGLCEYSGGKMKLTNSPDPKDGLFDISIIENVSKWEIIKHISKLYTGNLHKVKKVKMFKSESILIDIPNTKNLFIQADGEVFKAENINISIEKNVFNFYC